MSDPADDRADHTRPRRGPYRRGPYQRNPYRTGPHRRCRQGRGTRWTTVVVMGRAFLIAAGLVTAYYLLPLDRYSARGTSVLLLSGLLAVILVFVWEVRTIIRSPYPRLKAVEALAATLVLFLVLFASAYYLLDRSAPGSFTEPLSRTDALYFTLTTFSTVGFGDIAARSETGRVMTMLQMAGGLVLVGFAARVLASAVQAGLRRRGPIQPETDAGEVGDAVLSEDGRVVECAEESADSGHSEAGPERRTSPRPEPGSQSRPEPGP
ncbi:two pore domain potassium channel family protein [Streptomyces fagopyri]|uniref:Two pore domain potassium channel family protein n=2 Tax=Streptomyces fagopyri TaxID=2662397 RepID=A0A5Q0LKN9_9ACTN|nr:two pore domain potassium channel family protein [Streptomyces fagopyri]